MTLGNINKLLDSVEGKRNRKLIQSFKSVYEAQLKTVPELDKNLRRNYKWVELQGKIELCNKLLGSV